MIYLLVASLIWAFSFSLIKGNLTNLDSNFVAFARLFLSFLVFLPFLRIQKKNFKLLPRLLFVGAVQYGIMYVSYIYAFKYLKAYEVVIFTIFTPIYVVIINDIIEKKTHLTYYLTSVLALLGAAIIVWNDLISESLLFGFLLMQISNISFSFGQIYFKYLIKNNSTIKEKNIFALLYMGGFLTAGVFSFFTTDFTNLSLNTSELLTIIYLGIVASGLGFFFWNVGANKTNAGSLAVFNNLKIPLGIFVAITFFSEQINFLHFIIGGLLITLALSINEWSIYNNYFSIKKRIK